MELELGKKYECIRKSNGEVICTIDVMRLDWLDVRGTKDMYDFDSDLLDMGIYVFRDLEHRTDIFEIKFSPNNINPSIVYIKWLCKDFEIRCI